MANRENCPLRHENGNCICIGGFCTAVNDEICSGLLAAYDLGRMDGVKPVKKTETLQLFRAGDLLEWYRPYAHTDEQIPFDVLQDDLRMGGIPTVEARPVNHARWIKLSLPGMHREKHFCPECCNDAPLVAVSENIYQEKVVEERLTAFCPYCGAIMDEDGIVKNETD